MKKIMLILFCSSILLGLTSGCDNTNPLIGRWQVLNSREFVTFNSDMTVIFEQINQPDGPGVPPPPATKPNITVNRYKYFIDLEKSPHWIDLIRETSPARSEGLFRFSNNGEILEMLLSSPGYSRPASFGKQNGNYSMLRKIANR